jgi:hypothetical protein
MPSNAPRPAKPSREIFDAFNSSATGHQRAENRLSGSTSWRDSRNQKLRNQFTGGSGAGTRISDTVGAGSLDFGQDGRKANGGWEKGAPGLRKGGQQSILDSMGPAKIEEEADRPVKKRKIQDAVPPEPTAVTNPFTPFRRSDGSIRQTSWTSHEATPSHQLSPVEPSTWPKPEDSTSPLGEEQTEDTSKPQIFANLVLYVNGSCGAHISDHKLKHLWAEHGGVTSVTLGRRTVTHVVLDRPKSSDGSGGALAGSKIHKEITQSCGAVVKFVTSDWITESISAGKRLPESKFSALKLAPNGVKSVAGQFSGLMAKSNDATNVEGGES